MSFCSCLHSLLFSKTAPVQAIQKDEEEEIRRGTALYRGRPSTSLSQDTIINGADYAFKPKDVNLDKRINISPIDDKELSESESEIKATVSSLSSLFKTTGSGLPDGGAKIQKQIAELNQKLEDMKKERSCRVVRYKSRMLRHTFFDRFTFFE